MALVFLIIRDAKHPRITKDAKGNATTGMLVELADAHDVFACDVLRGEPGEPLNAACLCHRQRRPPRNGQMVVSAIMERVWTLNPHAGGIPISDIVKQQTQRRLLAHAEKHYAGRYARLDIRFKGALCYVDAFLEPDTRGSPWDATGETREQFVERLRSAPTHLCRLRHFAPDRWSVAFFTYSHERYEPSFFPSGEEFGTPEEAFDVGAVYLT